VAQGDAELCAGEQYHFYNRGHNRGAIFFERKNYLFFLRRVGEYLSPVLDIVAYCLMPTHYHLLVGVRKKSDVFKTSDFSLGGHLRGLTFLPPCARCVDTPPQPCYSRPRGCGAALLHELLFV